MYLHGTKDKVLAVSANELDFMGYVDVDLVRSDIDQKMVLLHTIEVRGGDRSWNEMVLLLNFLSELEKVHKMMIFYRDSQNIIHQAKTSTFYLRTKLVEFKYHFI